MAAKTNMMMKLRYWCTCVYLLLFRLLLAEGSFLLDDSNNNRVEAWEELVLQQQQLTNSTDDDSALRVRVVHTHLVHILANPAGSWPLTIAFPGVSSLLARKHNIGRGLSRANVLVECDFEQAPLQQAQLADKYNEIVTLSGKCSGGIQFATLVYNRFHEGTLSASFYPQDSPFQPIVSVREHVEVGYPTIDPNDYKLMAWQDLGMSERRRINFMEPPRGDNPAHHNDIHNPSNRELQDLMYGDITTYQIAVAGTRDFGTRITGLSNPTQAQIHAEVVAIMARINAIYMREMDVYFQLVANNDFLYCIDTFCDDWENENANTALNFVDDYITEAFTFYNTTEPSYDLNHLFQAPTPPPVGSGGSGRSYRSAICSTVAGGNGTNGVSSWTSQAGLQGAFFLSIVVHEMGHQLGAEHTFRDCNTGSGSEFGAGAAVEPGSGTTIMSRSGSCGSSNTNRDDYWFNSKNLEQMRTTVNTRTCGTDTTYPIDQPETMTQSSCTVPKGNYVQLDGSVNNDPTGNPLYYAWDRVDLSAANGDEDYLSSTVARFIPQQPTSRSSTRFLPNMYLLSFDLVDSQSFVAGLGYEQEPQDGGGDQIMAFRFIARTLFDTNALLQTTSFNAVDAGIWGYTDMTLTYDDSTPPLILTSSTPFLTGGDSVTFTWTGGDPTDQVQLYIALNTMTNLGTTYDYNTDVDDLNFQVMGGATAANVGTTTVTVPSIPNPSSQPAVVMLRSVNSNQCYYFDLQGDIAYNEGMAGTSTPTAQPTNSPTGSPTAGPTRAPSSQPTNSPTGSPTAGPTSAPSSQPTNSPTGSPTAGPTSAPSSQPTNSPTGSPTALPTSEPTNVPTVSPSLAPTQSPSVTQLPTAPTSSPTSAPTIGLTSDPTLQPTSQPSSSPTSAPTSAPTRDPTLQPTSSPTFSPTSAPMVGPTSDPTLQPTGQPTSSPTSSPTSVPTSDPTLQPTGQPTSSPTSAPTSDPTLQPTSSPTSSPTSTPSAGPNNVPTQMPSAVDQPTSATTSSPTVLLSDALSSSPTLPPTGALCLSPKVFCPSSFKSGNLRHNSNDGSPLFPICVARKGESGKGHVLRNNGNGKIKKSRTFGDVFISNGKKNIKGKKKIKGENKGKVKKKGNGKKKIKGEKKGKGKKKVKGTNDSGEDSEAVFETICISEEVYTKLLNDETTSDITCGCCDASQEEDLPEFCLGPL